MRGMSIVSAAKSVLREGLVAYTFSKKLIKVLIYLVTAVSQRIN